MNILIAGASGGIGRYLTKHFDVEGNALHLTYHNHPGKVCVPANAAAKLHLCDFTYAVDVRTMFEKIPSLDVIINCMGHVENKLVIRMDEDQWDRVIDANLKSVFLSCKWGAPKIVDGGHIINISSVLGEMGMQGASNYCAAKGAVEAFTRSFARECCQPGRRVFVNALSLGYFRIGMGLELGAHIADFVRERILLGEFGDPEEIGRTVDYIISSRYMAGNVLRLNGGLWNS